MSEANYWDRLARQRFSRRTLLRGAAYAGGGLTAAALIGCGDDGNGGDQGQQGEQGTSTQITEGRPGGTLRLDAFVFHDTFDPHLTQFGPIYSPLSGVFSKVLAYADIYENIVQPDLAESVEQAEQDQYVITLRDARFHNKPPVNGRAVEAEDVKFMIERQRDGTDPRFYRKSQWQTVNRVEVVDPKTLRIFTNGPVAPLQHYLADTNAHIVPRELLASKSELGAGTGGDPSVDMIGSGPFMWDSYQTLVEYRAKKNPDWFGWDKPDLARPYLDGYILNSAAAADAATRQSAFRSKQIDAAGFGDQPTALTDQLMQEFPELELNQYGSSGYINSRFLVSRPPFNDYRVRTALSIVIDRNHMADSLFFGAAKQNGVISWSIPAWALPDDEVTQFKGHRFSTADREADLAEAKQMWEAAGGASLGPLSVVIANIPTYLPQYGPAIKEQVKQHLGVDVNTEEASYNDIVERLLRYDMGWVYGFDNGWIDLDDWLYPYYHTGGPKNSFQFSDPEVDRMLERQRAEFDYEARREIGYEIQRYMMQDEVNIHPNWISALSRTLVWPYVKNFRGSPWFGNDFRLADYWLDTSDPSYQGRP